MFHTHVFNCSFDIILDYKAIFTSDMDIVTAILLNISHPIMRFIVSVLKIDKDIFCYNPPMIEILKPVHIYL